MTISSPAAAPPISRRRCRRSRTRAPRRRRQIPPSPAYAPTAHRLSAAPASLRKGMIEMKKHAALLATALLLLASGKALAVTDAPMSTEGCPLGSLADAAACPYIAKLQKAEPASFEALIMKIG